MKVWIRGPPNGCRTSRQNRKPRLSPSLMSTMRLSNKGCPKMSLRQSPILRTTESTDEVMAALALNPRSREDRNYIAYTAAASRKHEKGPWEWYGKIGEVRQAIARNSRIAGYAKLKLYKRKPDGTRGDEIITGPGIAALASLRSPFGGQRHLLERFYTLRKVPGSMYLIRTRNRAGEETGFMVLSADEIDAAALASGTNGTVKWYTTPNTGAVDSARLVYEIPAEDFVGRLWAPSPQFINVAESPLAALATECEVLIELTASLKAKIKSRFALAGLMYVPNEIQHVKASGISSSANRDGDLDDLTDVFVRAMTRNVQSRDEAAALVPIILRGPGEVADKLKHLTIDTQLWETDIQLRSELLGRILMSLDQQQDAVKGVGQSSHWSAWAVSDEERRIGVQPDLEAFCWALEHLVVKPEMALAGATPEQVAETMLWYDLSDSAVKSNQQEDARQAVDRLAVTNDALRRVSGFTDDDAPDDREYVRMLGAKIGDPYLATFGMTVANDIDWTKVGLGRSRRGPIAASPADEPGAGPGVGNPGSPDDIDSDTPRTQRPD